MSFLHCHTKDCYWSQDDFWDWNWKGLLRFWQWKRRPFGYNPISLIMEDIAGDWFPRFVMYDTVWAKDNGFKSNRIFSWHIMAWSIKRHARRVFTQKWWTWQSWQKVRHNAVCPKCKQRNWDID